MPLPDDVNQLPKHVAVYIICVYSLYVQVVGFLIVKIFLRVIYKARDFVSSRLKSKFSKLKYNIFILLKNASFRKRVQI
jgi:hypothetical protein